MLLFTPDTVSLVFSELDFYRGKIEKLYHCLSVYKFK